MREAAEIREGAVAHDARLLGRPPSAFREESVKRSGATCGEALVDRSYHVSFLLKYYQSRRVYQGVRFSVLNRAGPVVPHNSVLLLHIVTRI